jgi:hypothetical protein
MANVHFVKKDTHPTLVHIVTSAAVLARKAIFYFPDGSDQGMLLTIQLKIFRLSAHRNQDTKSTVFLFVSHECEIWRLQLRVGHGLRRMTENRVQGEYLNIGR